MKKLKLLPIIISTLFLAACNSITSLAESDWVPEPIIQEETIYEDLEEPAIEEYEQETTPKENYLINYYKSWDTFRSGGPIYKNVDVAGTISGQPVAEHRISYDIYNNTVDISLDYMIGEETRTITITAAGLEIDYLLVRLESLITRGHIAEYTIKTDEILCTCTDAGKEGIATALNFNKDSYLTRYKGLVLNYCEGQQGSSSHVDLVFSNWRE